MLTCGVRIVACLAIAGALAAQATIPRVVFVCEHGSVKSLIAAQWFNRLARERKLAFVAVSRGVAPDESVPAAVAENLRQDGFDLAGVSPVRLDKRDLDGAAHVVAIGVKSPLFDGLATSPEAWDDVPPVSTHYEDSRDAMRRRIEALLDRLAR